MIGERASMRWVVGGLTLVAAAWLLRAAWSWGPGYDEWWHVWIGEARSAAHLWRELLVETHPPLSHLGVRLFSEPGDPIGWARLVSVLPAVATVPLWFLAARRFGVSSPTACVVLAAIVGSQAFTGMGITVRGYSLATMFATLALCGIAPLTACPAAFRTRDAWWLAIGTIGAVWSIYTEGLLATAMCGAGLVLLLLDPTLRGEVAARLLRSWLPLALAAVGAIAALVYWRSTLIVRMQTYMPDYLPRVDESALGFLGRGASSLVGLFTLGPVGTLPWLALPIAFLFLGALWWGRREGWRSRRFVALAIVGVTAQLYVAAMLRQLPFGGQLRHQYVLFPLLTLGAALLIDRLRGAGRGYAVALAAFVITAASVSTWSYRHESVDEFRRTPVDRGVRAALTELAAPGDTVLMRRYGLVPTYVALRADGGFTWHGFVPLLGEPADDLRAKSGDLGLRLLVSSRRFAVAARVDDGLMDEARALLREQSLPHLLVLATGQPRDGFPTEAAARAAATASGLRITGLSSLPEGLLLRVALAND